MSHDKLDRRPPAAKRRKLRAWALVTFRARCWGCAVPLDNETMQLDRIDPDGTYVRGNVRPSCARCNYARRRARRRAA